jgi:integrase
MSRYQQGCLYREQRKAGDIWVFRWRDGRTNRKEQVGTVEQFPSRKAAMKACEPLRANIHKETRSPRTVAELVNHYTRREIDKKAYSTKAAYESYIRLWVLPKWGDHVLSNVRTVDVEAWLASVPLTDGTRAKIRNVMSAIFTHAMRHEWLDRNPIALVRQSAKRERLPDVLTVAEIRALLRELRDPCRTAVLLATCTGLRVSELLALKWEDVHFDKGEILPVRAIVDQVVGSLKTEASGKALPMDAALAGALLDWRGRCPYNQDGDFLFASPDMGGKQPYWPEGLIRRQVKPAAVRCGITKRIGWHSFRRTLATLLQADGNSVKVTQDLMRHASSRITLDMYAQSIPADRRAAQERVTGAVLRPSVPGSFPDKLEVIVGT